MQSLAFTVLAWIALEKMYVLNFAVEPGWSELSIRTVEFQSSWNVHALFRGDDLSAEIGYCMIAENRWWQKQTLHRGKTRA